MTQTNEALVEELARALAWRDLSGKRARGIKQDAPPDWRLFVDDVRAILPIIEAREQAVREEGWQPIETAPKDGTQVLIAGGTVEYGAETFPEDRPFGGVQIASWDEGSSSWMGPYGSEYDACYWHTPTHWMPLPAPPAKDHPHA